MIRVALVVGLLVTCACRQAASPDLLTSGTWIDLSYEYSIDTIYWPTAKPFDLVVESAQRTPAGYYYAANSFTTSEHGGTHLDAPVHFAEGKWTTEAIPLERLIGPAVVVDVSESSHREHRLSDHRRCAGSLGARSRQNLRRGDRPLPHRLGPAVARPRTVSGNHQNRSRRCGRSALPGDSSRRGQMAGLPWRHRRRRHRHGQHRPRAVEDVRHPSGPARPPTFRHSKTWRNSIGCLPPAASWSRCR